MRIDPNNLEKEAIFINVYVNSFVKEGVNYNSQDEQWLKSSLKDLKFIEYIDNINEIKWK